MNAEGLRGVGGEGVVTCGLEIAFALVLNLRVDVFSLQIHSRFYARYDHWVASISFEPMILGKLRLSVVRRSLIQNKFNSFSLIDPAVYPHAHRGCFVRRIVSDLQFYLFLLYECRQKLCKIFKTCNAVSD